ncbi:MAG TPA: hypothetical protein DD640_08450 [Clostridiales bacterium]|nr:hypothetical protein [Clostridiales bacterium]
MKALVVGLGSMGGKRMRILKEMGIETIGVDMREARRQQAWQQYGVRAFPDFEAALLEKPDLLLVCTWPHDHMRYVRRALEQGIHVFSEDTCMDDLDQLTEVIELARSKPHLVAAPSCTMRYHVCIQKIKEIIDSGVLGPRERSFATYHGGSYLPDWHTYEGLGDYYAGQRKTGGGCDMITFEFDWLCWLLGDVRKVSALARKNATYDADIFDTYQILAELEAGNILTATIDVVTRYANRYFRYVTEKGEIYWEINTHTVRLHTGDTDTWRIISEKPVSGPASSWSLFDIYRDEVRVFLEACQGKTKYPIGFDNDLRMCRLVQACEKSSEEGVFVSL